MSQVGVISTPSPRRVPWWAVVLIGLCLAVAGWLAAARPWQARPVTVTVETVTPEPASRVLAVNGRIEPRTQIQVQPIVAGQVKSVGATDGDVVSEGAVLAAIDDSQQRAAVSQADSAIHAARAQLDKATADYDRARSLGDAISQKDLDAARVAKQTAQNDVERLTAARDQAASLLAQYTITAPFDGTVVTRGVDPGQVVSPSTTMFVLADLTHVRASASVDELYAAEIKRGLPVRLQPSGYNRVLEGTVSFVSPTVDASTGGRLVRVDIADLAGLTLPIGLTVNLNIVVDQETEALTVPRPAILDPTTKPGVLLVKNGKAVRKDVEFIDWPAGRLMVTSGLEAGDVVITNPTPAMESAAVEVKGN